MTWAAAIFTPIVVLYQGWTYWVFFPAKRLTLSSIPADALLPQASEGLQGDGERR